MSDILPWVVNCVRDCYRPSKGLDRELVKHIVVHHCSLSNHDEAANPHPISDDKLTAVEMSQRFKNRALGTGGLMPYHLLVLTNGGVQQAIPLNRRGCHAVGVNWCSLAVCVVGEHQPASEWQQEALARIVSLLVVYCRGTEGMVIGHSDVPGGSKDPGKKCPWPTVNVGALRRDVANRLPEDLDNWPASHADKVCREAGLVLE